MLTAFSVPRGSPVAALESGDLDAYLGHLAEDAVVMPPGSPPIEGRQAIREWMGETLLQFDISVQVSTVELIIARTWAIDRHDFVQSITPRDGGEQTQIEGKAIAIYRKTAGGEWQAYVDCWNNNSS